jgi:hypothetical protein
MFEPQKKLNSVIKEGFWTIHEMLKAPKRGGRDTRLKNFTPE